MFSLIQFDLHCLNQSLAEIKTMLDYESDNFAKQAQKMSNPVLRPYLPQTIHNVLQIVI